MEQPLRHHAIYCAPHAKVPGELTVSPSFLVLFDPDAHHGHIRECGAQQYQVRLEVCDVIECGALTVPIQESGEDAVAFFLQMHVRTLDGEKRCAVEDSKNTWCLVFRLRSKDALHEVCRRVLTYLEVTRAEKTPSSPKRTTTFIPFPCLDCAAEMEAAAMEQKRQEVQAMQLRAFIAGERQKHSERAKKSGSPSTSPPKSPKKLMSSVVRDDDSSTSDHSLGVVLQPGNVSNPLLTEALAAGIFEYLPVSVRIEGAVQWVLVYTPKAHGVSLGTLYRNVGRYDKSILFVQDAEGHVFGGYAPVTWEPCGRFYGSGEAFVFSFGYLSNTDKLQPPQPKVYPWSSENSYFLFSDDAGIAMGGGNGRHAVFLASDLLRGCSAPTDTFRNQTLAASEEFVVKDLEIWAFEEV